MAIAIVVAAGRGERLGAGRPKALVPLLDRPLVAWALEVLVGVRPLRRIVVVLPPDESLPVDPREWGLPPGSWTGPDGDARVVAVAGGAARAHSVRAGLGAGGDGPVQEPILVHDGARPLVTPELVRSCLLGISAGADAAIAAAPLTDTVKQAYAPDGADGLTRVERTLDRSRLWAVQTPQAFRRGVLARVLDGTSEQLAAATDEASLVEAAGGDVRLVPASTRNLKVTGPEDLHLAALLLADLRKTSVSC